MVKIPLLGFFGKFESKKLNLDSIILNKKEYIAFVI